MATKIALRCKQTSDSTGLDNYVLSGTIPFGFQAFMSDTNIADQDDIYYLATDVDFSAETGQWEIAIGTINDLTNDRMDRKTLLASTTGSWISWGVGTRDVVGILPADGFMLGSNNLSELTSPSAARTNLALGTAATKNEGHGNTLDADTLDTYEATVFVEKAADETITGANTLSGDNTFSGDNEFSGTNNFNNTGGRVVLPVYNY